MFVCPIARRSCAKIELWGPNLFRQFMRRILCRTGQSDCSRECKFKSPHIGEQANEQVKMPRPDMDRMLKPAGVAI